MPLRAASSCSLVDPGRGLGHGLRHRDTAQRVERMAFAPQVGIGQARAARQGIGEDFDGALRLAARHGHAPQAAAGNAFPARVADLAAEGKRMLEAVRGGIDVAAQQVDFGAQRLRPGHKSGPALLGQGHRAVQRAGRAVEFAVQQQRAAQHGQRIGELLVVAGCGGQCLGLAQQGDGGA
jgi:hypothetical protein